MSTSDANRSAGLPGAGFQTLASLAQHGVLVASGEGAVSWANQAAELALGDGGRVALLEAWPALLARMGADGASGGCGVLALGDDGDSPLRIEVHPVNGAASTYVVFMDTHGADAATRLELANQALTNAYLASALLHEINAPLNNIKLTLALCEASLLRAVGAVPVDVRQRLERYFKVVGDETTRLTLLLEELRRMSATVRAAPETFDLRDLTHEIRRLLRHEATIRQIRLDLQPGEAPLPVCADRQPLLLALLGVMIHLIEQSAPESVIRVSLSRAHRRACILLDSTAAADALATRDALERVTASLRRDDIPLVAARAHIEALHGSLRAVAQDGRFGIEVRLPLTP